MRLIQTVSVTAATQATIEFTSIPQNATDLVAVLSARSDVTGTAAVNVFITFNSNTTGYSWQNVQGTGSAVAGSSGTTQISGLSVRAGATASTFSNSTIYIPTYATALNKAFYVDSVGENNGTESYQSFMTGLWSNTAAITSIAFTTTNNFVTGTSISLYQITRGSDGIVTVS